MHEPHPPSAVFLDRDGTVIIDKPYLSDPDLVELTPHALEGLGLLAEARIPLVLITNQSGIGRGFYTQKDMEAVHTRLCELLAGRSITLAGIYFCPHAPEENCTCRKPAPDMAFRAAADLGIDLCRSAFIGNTSCDMALARVIRARSILLGAAPVTAGYRATDLLDAARFILRTDFS